MNRNVKILSVFVLLALIMGTIHFSLANVKEGISFAQEEGVEREKGLDERLQNAIALYVGSSQAYVKNVEKQVDPENPNIKPYVKNGRTLVPVRFVSESLGADVGWDQNTSEVTVSLDGKVLKFVTGNKTMMAGNESIELDTAAEISQGRTYLPLRALAEALDRKVFYDRGLIVIGDEEAVFDIDNEKSMIDEVIAKVNNLPVVGTYEELEKLFESSGAYNGRDYQDDMWMFDSNSIEFSIADESMKRSGANSKASEQASVADSASGASSSSGSTKDYSKTNVQVQGVDEADVVKTDGDYIYQVNKERIVIARAYDSVSQKTYSSGGMKIMSVMDFSKDNFTPQELYVDGKYLTVIGSYYEEIPYDGTQYKQGNNRIMPHYRHKTTTKAIICDISDRSNIRKEREVEVEGYYVSSRKIGPVLYMVANKHSNAYFEQDILRVETPSYKDTQISNEYIGIECPDIRYFPGSVETNYLTVAAVDIEGSKKANVQTFLGAGENIYASTENLYVAVTGYNYNTIYPALEPVIQMDGASSRAIAPDVIRPVSMDGTMTKVYKFSLDGSRVTYLSCGEVPGTILNQYSMDENGSYFRIATTVGEVWGRGGYQSKNNLYILDDTMNISGKLENMAPGERIYSVRFMGDRGYIVTFKTVDPLFVIDLKDPAKPKVLGELKIPGYSDYLHPYDENHIIGFGKDTIELQGNAYYQGMKIALFDVTDVKNPKQKFSEKIGDRGTDSELLRNPKALLFSKEKNLLAFPVTVMEIDENTDKRGKLSYGQFAFQGAYVYDIDIKDGFQLRGKITHLAGGDISKAGDYYYYPDKYVERILYIDDILYTLSKGMIKANDLYDLVEIDSLDIPE